MKTITRIAAVLSAVLTVSPASAGGLPVIDTTNAAINAKSAANILQQVAIGGEQLRVALDNFKLSTIAGYVLGEGPGGDFTALMSSLEGVYSSGSGLYNSVMTKQARLTQEWNELVPPVGMEGMTAQQIFALTRRWQGVFREDTIAAAQMQSLGLRAEAKLREAAMNGTIQADKAKSAVAATQGLTHVAASMAGQLSTIQTSLATMGQDANRRDVNDIQMQMAADAIRKKDLETLKAMIDAGPATAKINPIYWGR